MRCEECHGSGIGPVEDVGLHVPVRPMWLRMYRFCQACGGTGVASCCEGMVGGSAEVTNGGLTIDYLEIGTRLTNCLRRSGLTRVENIVRRRPSNLLNIPGLGRVSLAELQRALRTIGARLQPEAWEVVCEPPAYYGQPACNPSSSASPSNSPASASANWPASSASRSRPSSDG